jgi:translation initiation factor 2B subunit (eIF-2B alpha/beta/delta family)
MKRTLDYLQGIKTTSSFDFCLYALQYLQNSIKMFHSKNMDRLLQDLNQQGRAITKMQPNMANLKKKIAVVIYILKKAIKTKKSDAEIKRYTFEKIQDLIELAHQKRDTIAVAGSKLITQNARIVTIGYSSLISAILITAHTQKRKFEVYCLESAPTGEGILLAETLARKGISTFLSSDVSMGSILQHATLVLSGAVRIYEDGFINKIGTLPLALSARAMKIPICLAAETDKILREREYAVRFYKRNPREIYIPRSKNIKIFNVHYESIPLTMITKFITEDGVFDPVEFKNWYLKE